MNRHVDAVTSEPHGLSTAPDGPNGLSEEELRAQERIQQLEEDVASKDELVQAMVRMSTMSDDRLKTMSDGSRALASRITPTIWAQNLHEQLARRVERMKA